VYVLYPLGCVLQLVSTPETFGIGGDTVGLLIASLTLPGAILAWGRGEPEDEAE
jgi:hypothetical protein